jgi:hypothetical protein
MSEWRRDTIELVVADETQTSQALQKEQTPLAQQLRSDVWFNENDKHEGAQKEIKPNGRGIDGIQTDQNPMGMLRPSL